jgi:hypothetical protein
MRGQVEQLMQRSTPAYASLVYFNQTEVTLDQARAFFTLALRQIIADVPELAGQTALYSVVGREHVSWAALRVEFPDAALFLRYKKGLCSYVKSRQMAGIRTQQPPGIGLFRVVPAERYGPDTLGNIADRVAE